MAYKLIVMPRAKSSLEEIGSYYLSEHSLQRALKVIASIEEAFDSIVKAPKRNPVCFDVETPSESIRQTIVHNTFKIIYRINGDYIEITEVFHGSRDTNLLKDIND